MDFLRQLISLTVAILVSLLCAMLTYQIVLGFIQEHNANQKLGVAAAWLIGTLVSAYLFIAGIQKLGPVDKGVALFLGARLHPWVWTIPAGLSWFVPRPFGDSIPFYVGEQTLDRTNSSGNPLTEVLTKDGIDIGVSALVQWSINNVYAYSGVENPGEAFTTLVQRTIRWYVSLFPADVIIEKKREISQVLRGEQLSVTDQDGAEHQLESRITEIAAKWGIGINHALVDDFNLPQTLVSANEQKQVEAAQAISEGTQHENLMRRAEKLKGKFPEISDAEALMIDQAERGKLKRIVVEGSAGDFTKGAAVRNRGDK